MYGVQTGGMGVENMTANVLYGWALDSWLWADDHDDVALKSRMTSLTIPLIALRLVLKSYIRFSWSINNFSWIQDFQTCCGWNQRWKYISLIFQMFLIMKISSAKFYMVEVYFWFYSWDSEFFFSKRSFSVFCETIRICFNID